MAGDLPVIGQDPLRAVRPRQQLSPSLVHGPAYDYVLNTGDNLSHGFEQAFQSAGGAAKDYEGFVIKTLQFVDRMLAQSFPGVPLISTLGNNDSTCGDYMLAPGSAMLTALGRDLPAVPGNPQALRDFSIGGFYLTPHPTVPKHDIVVLSDVFWSRSYHRGGLRGVLLPRQRQPAGPCGAPLRAVPEAADRMRPAIGLALALALTATPLRANASPAGESIVLPISDALCADMKRRHVLNPGAVVGCGRLRLVKFSYAGFDGQIHSNGEVVVLDAAAEHTAKLFDELREKRFPIAKAVLMNRYDGDDDASIADNNTSAFNDRIVEGSASKSLHAFGLAIDINPVQNPYLVRSESGATVSPPAGAAYLNRRGKHPAERLRLGMAEAVLDVFAAHGFTVWGGRWRTQVDYQHFTVSRTLARQLIRAKPSDAQALFTRHVERYLACRGNAGRTSCLSE